MAEQDVFGPGNPAQGAGLERLMGALNDPEMFEDMITRFAQRGSLDLAKLDASDPGAPLAAFAGPQPGLDLAQQAQGTDTAPVLASILPTEKDFPGATPGAQQAAPAGFNNTAGLLQGLGMIQNAQDSRPGLGSLSPVRGGEAKNVLPPDFFGGGVDLQAARQQLLQSFLKGGV